MMRMYSQNTREGLMGEPVLPHLVKQDAKPVDHVEMAWLQREGPLDVGQRQPKTLLP